MSYRFDPVIHDLFDHSKVILPSSICFSDEVRGLCEKNMCGWYNKSWTCPPAIGSIENLQSGLAGFNRFCIVDKVYPLKSSFDWKGMVSGAKDFQSRLLRFKKVINETESDTDFLVLGAGACQLCDTCTYPMKKPCKNPENALVSIEAYGIDAMKMMKDNGLNYNNGPNTVTYIGGIFFIGSRCPQCSSGADLGG